MIRGEIGDYPPWMQEQIKKKLAAQTKVIPKTDVSITPPVEAPSPPPKPKNKYGNRKAVRGNIGFDSEKEARRYDELMLMLKAGEIKDLKLQPQFFLQESYVTPEGERIRAITYIADFSYMRKEESPIGTGWFSVVEDVKSKATRTQKYIIKRKLLHERRGITVTEV